jgi:Phage integrase, N-terminal SAM-like domain
MATTIPSAALVPVAPVFTNAERLALAGFLAGYSGLTRQAYELDLRQFASWCQQHQLHLFAARRADIEFFARDLEARGRARATITRRLCTIAGFYRYAVEEELLDHSPAVVPAPGAERGVLSGGAHCSRRLVRCWLRTFTGGRHW